ncbi:hypothetical protein JCM3770_002897, partial [Rhodotorula araucariae]
ETDPSTSNVRGLIKAVEVQLLSSDLSTSILLPTPAARRAALATRTPASARTVLFAEGGRKDAVLFQVVRAGDAAHSAVHGREVLADKRDALASTSSSSGARVVRLGEGEDAATPGGGGGDGVGGAKDAMRAPVFPRGSGSFVLSDGETEVRAFERERIDGLGLEEVKLGTKLLIREAPFVNGIMMLTRQNTVVKGFQVEELEAVKEWLLENGFRARLGMDPLPPPDPAAAAGLAPSSPLRSPRARQRTPPAAPRVPSSDYFGDDLDLELALADQVATATDEDEDEALRAIEAEAAAPGPAFAPVPPRRARPVQVKPEPRSSGTGRASGGGRGAAVELAGKVVTGLSGHVEVLELDTDGDEDDDGMLRVGGDGGPKRRRMHGRAASATAAGPRAGGMGAKAEGGTMVLELDSDD